MNQKGKIESNKYSNILEMPREERIVFIKKILEEDPKTIPKNGSYDIIAEKTNEFIEHCFYYDREHPIITEHGDRIFFEAISPENDLASQVRYASHFVTGDTLDEKRSYDSSKAEAIYFIMPLLKEVEKIYHQPSNNRFVYTKEIRIGKYCCMILDVETSIEGGLRSYTILPNQSYTSIARKKHLIVGLMPHFLHVTLRNHLLVQLNPTRTMMLIVPNPITKIQKKMTLPKKILNMEALFQIISEFMLKMVKFMEF